MKSKPYRGVSVKQVDAGRVLAGHDGEGVEVGSDIGKEWIWVTLRWGADRFDRPWKVRNPWEIAVAVEKLAEVGRGRRMRVAMESSGTYGEAFRQALTDAQLDVYRVSGKAVHDFSEVFDGVPSSHDGKDPAVVAELLARGHGQPWPHVAESLFDQELARDVDRIEAHEKIKTTWTNRLEGMMARHWPEALSYLKASSATLLHALAHYGGPKALGADPEAALRLRRWGRSFLAEDKIAQMIGCAGRSIGVRMGPIDEERIKGYAVEALWQERQIAQAEKRLRAAARGHEVVERLASVAGTCTACVAWMELGDPRGYGSAGAYRKAMGLNLKERSSGQEKGQVKISKRGPSRMRRWLYFAAMRALQEPSVRAWYAAKTARSGGNGGPGMVGIMRKLAAALWVVGAREQEYDPKRLFSRRWSSESATTKEVSTASMV